MSHMKCVLKSMRTPHSAYVFIKHDTHANEDGSIVTEISWVEKQEDATIFDMLDDQFLMGGIITTVNQMSKAHPNNYLFAYVETFRIRELSL